MISMIDEDNSHIKQRNFLENMNIPIDRKMLNRVEKFCCYVNKKAS